MTLKTGHSRGLLNGEGAPILLKNSFVYGCNAIIELALGLA
jgi:hypothetical protein